MKKESDIKQFYRSWAWQTARMKALRSNPTVGKCNCCGWGVSEGAKLCVDHIKPLRTHWNLRLVQSNLQILCDNCNRGKGSWDWTDWRTFCSHEFPYGPPDNDNVSQYELAV